jgi:hypothetical protein
MPRECVLGCLLNNVRVGVSIFDGQPGGLYGTAADHEEGTILRGRSTN